MQNEINPRLDRLETKFDGFEQTNHKILDVLQSLQNAVTNIQAEMATKSELKTFRLEVQKEFSEFRSEVQGKFDQLETNVQEQFECLIETAVTKTEFEKAIQTIRSELATKATKIDFINFTDRMDAKFLDFKRAIVEGIRCADKKFHAFAI